MKVELGVEDYDLDVHQYVYIEVLNHENAKVRLIKTEQIYGPC